MNSGTIVVEWDVAGHLTIKASFSMNDSHGRKVAIEKLLDAARAVNDQGTSLLLPPTSSTRLLTAK